VGKMSKRFPHLETAQARSLTVHMMIDLHAHTTASDGTLTPQALVDLAAVKGVGVLGVTDHDTVAGVPPALERGEERAVQVIPGIELGAKWSGGGQMHILGYHINWQDPRLLDQLSGLQAERRKRAQRIVDRLNELGVPISWERVTQLAGSGSIGRPHVARALLESGHVRAISEAFSLYLRPGAPAYIEKVEFTPAEAIELIRSSGGVPVLAHPTTLKLAGSKLEACLEDLVGKGLAGIEVYWAKHTEIEKAAYGRLAARYNLVATMGSDFHGGSKPGIELGMGFTESVDADQMLAALSFRRRAKQGARELVGKNSALANWPTRNGSPSS
jgi:3',5'-nucleoside bisphosphate phosphatase